MEIMKWDFFEAAEAGDVATLEGFFAQHAVIQEALSVDALITDEHLCDVDNRWRVEHNIIPLDSWLYFHNKNTNIFTAATTARQHAALKWLFTSEATRSLQQTLRFYFACAAEAAARQKDSELLEMLLALPIFANDGYPAVARIRLLSTLLKSAVDSRNCVLMDLVLAHGAEVHGRLSDGTTPLSRASASDTEGSVAKHLLAAGAPVLDDGVIIHRVSEYGHHLAVPILIEHGIDPLYVSSDNETALHRAAHEGFFAVIDALLLTSCIDIDAQNIDGDTALTLAVKENPFEADDEFNEDDDVDEPVFHPKVIEILMRHGADAELRSNGRTALMWAVLMGNTSVMRTLLQYGADPRACLAHLEENGLTDDLTDVVNELVSFMSGMSPEDATQSTQEQLQQQAGDVVSKLLEQCGE